MRLRIVFVGSLPRSSRKEVLTMDTSNNTITNVKVRDLVNSIHTEDNEMVNGYEKVLGRVIAKLKPILRYVCSPRRFWQVDAVRCIFIGLYGNDQALFMTEGGTFFSSVQKKCGSMYDYHIVYLHLSSVDELLTKGDSSWMNFPFITLLQRLEECLAEAEKKREAHLKAVMQRRRSLTKMLAALEESND